MTLFYKCLLFLNNLWHEVESVQFVLNIFRFSSEIIIKVPYYLNEGYFYCAFDTDINQ